MKRCMLLILVSMYMDALYPAAEKRSLPKVEDCFLALKLAIASGSYNYLSPVLIDLIGDYHGYPWKEQSIAFDGEVDCMAVSPNREHIAVAIGSLVEGESYMKTYFGERHKAMIEKSKIQTFCPQSGSLKSDFVALKVVV